MAKSQKTRKKQPVRSPAKAKKKSARKSAAPTNRKLQAQAREVLMDLLVQVLTNAPLRKKSGVNLKGKQEVSLSCEVDFLNGPQMRRVNQKFRKKNSVTDVLSFPTPEVFREQGMLGEILICTPVLLAQARELGHRWQDELAVLLVHGVLHLLDFDHERGAKHAKAMQTWEARLLPHLQAAGLIARSAK